MPIASDLAASKLTIRTGAQTVLRLSLLLIDKRGLNKDTNNLFIAEQTQFKKTDCKFCPKLEKEDPFSLRQSACWQLILSTL